MNRKKGEDKCRDCGKKTKDLYMYVDESNIAITRNSPFLCKSCYIKRYGEGK